MCSIKLISNVSVSSNSISSTMTTYEGIKSFYDYRKVTAEQLKKDAQQLIDVSNNKNGLAKQIVAASEQRKMANGKVANSNHVVFRTVKQFMTVWQQWRLEMSVSRQLFNPC